MSVLEVEEKSVEEAIAAACRETSIFLANSLKLKLSRRVPPGIFGIVGAKKAKIRVSAQDNASSKLLPSTPRPSCPIFFSTSICRQSSNGNRKDDHFYLNIISNGSGLLIGKRGKTLNALQYLVSKILHKEVGNENYSVIVDTENYRSKREQSLSELAQQLSDKVKKSHRPLTTGPMNAQDRRIIHLALKEDQEVRTKSKGEGTLRRVVIYPVKRGQKAFQDRDGRRRGDGRAIGFGIFMIEFKEDTICAIATPVGEGGIGIIKISGTGIVG